MKTGNTTAANNSVKNIVLPQWSPVMKTGNTLCCCDHLHVVLRASMEPGHEDREYELGIPEQYLFSRKPQWSPVMKTGNTPRRCYRLPPGRDASMEPGHEDREYQGLAVAHNPPPGPQWSPVMKTGNTHLLPGRGVHLLPASMEPGHEDREYQRH